MGSLVCPDRCSLSILRNSTLEGPGSREDVDQRTERRVIKLPKVKYFIYMAPKLSFVSIARALATYRESLMALIFKLYFLTVN